MLIRLKQKSNAWSPMLVTGTPSISLGISNSPPAEVSQSVISIVSSSKYSYVSVVVPVPTGTEISSALATSPGAPEMISVSVVVIPENAVPEMRIAPAVRPDKNFFAFFILTPPRFVCKKRSLSQSVFPSSAFCRRRFRHNIRESRQHPVS